MEWIYLEVDESAIKPIAQRLYNKDLERAGYKIEENPHITLVPGYQTNKDVELPMVNHAQPVEVSGFRFYPDIEDPMVVMIDVSDASIVKLWRDELIHQIGESNIQYDITPPHITLFKAGDSGDEFDFSIEPELRNRILDETEDINLPNNVRVTGVKKSEWESY